MTGRRRVVVTGLGVVSALGLDERALGRRLFAGEGGVRRIRAFDLAGYRCTSGAEVDDGELRAALADRGWRRVDRTLDMAMLASAQALEQAGLAARGAEHVPQAVGTLFGTGWGPTESLVANWQSYQEKGLKGLRPTTVPRCMMNAISSQVSMRFRLTGPNYVVVSACASSTVAIGMGYRMIRDGHAERVLCGGADAMFDPAVYGSWNNLGVLSRNENPERACRPFDAERDGFVLGEGAGALVLESLESAHSRGARARAEIRGYGESSDAEHVTRPSEQGQTRAMSAALADAGLEPSGLGFVNAHGTATQANDECECRSLRAVLGAEVERVPVVSSKPYFGHLIGGAGAVETIATILCLEAGRVHRSLNLDRPDELCDVHLVRERAVDLEMPTAMMNSFGFGGNNAVLVLRGGELA